MNYPATLRTIAAMALARFRPLPLLRLGAVLSVALLGLVALAPHASAHSTHAHASGHHQASSAAATSPMMVVVFAEAAAQPASLPADCPAHMPGHAPGHAGCCASMASCGVGGAAALPADEPTIAPSLGRTAIAASDPPQHGLSADPAAPPPRSI